jgi:oligopeptide transport system ATP-binding protein
MQTLRAVDGIDLQVDRGQTLAIVGESGCGKSTTARLLLRLIDATSGKVWFEGDDLGSLNEAAVRKKRRFMQMIFQDPYASLNPRMTIGQTLGEPMTIHGVPVREHGERIGALLRRVGLPASCARRYPHEFSGGQRQRVGIARALAVEPHLIICDEPVSALDVSVQAQVINLLQDLQDETAMAYVFIAHDLAVVRHLATDVAVMYLGRIVESGTAAEVFGTPRHPYTQALLASVPRGLAAHRNAPSQLTRATLRGDVPSPLAPPSGCRFRTRCRFAQPRCAMEDPLLDAQAESGARIADPGGPSAAHRVACFFWRDIAPTRSGGDQGSGGPGYAPLQNPRILALQSAFARTEVPVTEHHPMDAPAA